MKQIRILIADDDETLCYLLKEELLNEGFYADIVNDGKYAIDSLNKSNYDILLLDLEMKNINGENVLAFIKDNSIDVQVIVITGKTGTRTAIECLRIGAFDFLSKPYDFDELLVTINRAIDHKNLLVNNKILSAKTKVNSINKMIGNGLMFKKIVELALKAAHSDSNILLEGETGAGKEIFAEFIHNNSERNTKPMVTINCASLPDQLIESELFGFEKGAFTDAKASKQGLVEIADGGTLFLDEIGELSLSLQPKLLRFLENGEFRRVGGVVNLSSNVRIICATNRKLEDQVKNKQFRQDLLFRLNVITLKIPPLRERTDDIIPLANYFLTKKTSVRSPKQFSKEAENVLLQYKFPGNIRELQHIVERSIIFADGNIIYPKDLNLFQDNSSSLPNSNTARIEELVSLDDLEKNHILFALEKLNWNREKTANTLGISLKTLYTKIKKYNLKQIE